jgi:hypothetical protein
MAFPHKYYDSALVVLTHGVRLDKKVWVPDEFSAMRVNAATLVYRDLMFKGKSVYFIVSGGYFLDRRTPSLSRIVGNYALECGVGHDDLCYEEEADTTSENIKRSLEEMIRMRIKSGMFVTNNFQLGRASDFAKRYCKKMSIELSGRSAEELIAEYTPERKPEMTAIEQRQDVVKLARYHSICRFVGNMPLGTIALKAGAHLRVMRLMHRFNGYHS